MISNMVIVMPPNNPIRKFPSCSIFEFIYLQVHEDSSQQVVISRIVRSRMSRKVTGPVLWGSVVEYKTNHKVDVIHLLRSLSVIKLFIMAQIPDKCYQTLNRSMVILVVAQLAKPVS